MKYVAEMIGHKLQEDEKRMTTNINIIHRRFQEGMLKSMGLSDSLAMSSLTAPFSDEYSHRPFFLDGKSFT